MTDTATAQADQFDPVQALPFKEWVIAFTVGIYLLEQLLNVRQYRRMCDPYAKLSNQDVVNEEEYIRSQAYNRDKAYFAFVHDAWSLGYSLWLLTYNIIPLLWQVVEDLLLNYGGIDVTEGHEILHSVVFVLLTMLASSVTELPFSLYSTFVIEERHGFNKQTVGLFVSDLVKGWLVGLVIGAPFIAAFLSIIRWAGESFYVYLWVFMVVFQLTMMSIYPVLIQPLFNKLTPLEGGQLRDSIEALASRIRFPLTKLYVIDGSRRSSHSNAYFYGFFNNKHIVLFDTLLQDNEEDEICAVLAHELGHWQYSHTLRQMILAQLHMFVVFYLFSHTYRNPGLYSSFGFAAGVMPIIIGFVLFSFILAPVETVVRLVMTILSRRYEFEADRFAVALGYAKPLRAGLIKLHTKNLGNMNPDPWYSAYHYSHPPLVERLAALDKKRD